MRLILDVDGVIADLIPTWLHFYNIDYGDCLIEDSIVEWEIDRFVKEECGKKIYSYLKLPYLYDFVKPYIGADYFVSELRKMVDISFVTTVVDGGEGKKLDWLRNHGFYLPVDRYYEAKSPEDKHAITANFMVDDYIKNLEGFNGIGIMMTRNWNNHIPYPYKFDSYGRILSFIRESI